MSELPPVSLSEGPVTLETRNRNSYTLEEGQESSNDDESIVIIYTNTEKGEKGERELLGKGMSEGIKVENAPLVAQSEDDEGDTEVLR